MKKYLGGVALVAMLVTCLMVGNSEGQSGGGFPSRPTFQQVTVSGTGASPINRSASVTGSDTTALVNTSTVSGDTERLSIQAGTSNLQIGVCNQNQSGLCKLVGGPTVASGWIETFGAIPLCIGTSNNARWCMDAAGVISQPGNPYFIASTGTPTITTSTTPIDVTGVTGISVIAGKFYTFTIVAQIDTGGFATLGSINFAWVPTAGFVTNFATMTASDDNGGSPPPGTSIGSMSKTATMEPNQAVVIAPSNTANERVLTITGLATFDTTTTMKLQAAAAAATSHFRIESLKLSLVQAS